MSTSSDFTIPAGLPFKPTGAPPKASTLEDDRQRGLDLPSEMAGQTEALEKVSESMEVKDKKASYTDEELDNFWDAMLANKPYREPGIIGKGKRVLRYVFCTRSTEDINAIAELLDEADIRLKTRYESMQSQWLLASSLYSYDSKILPQADLKDAQGRVTSTAIEQRFEFVKALPAIWASAMISKLRSFDIKISEMQEAVFNENFS